MAKRILVADDSVTIQKAFAMVFAGSDFTLVSARSVDEAVSAARHGRPDLVIADAVLGGSNGYDLCSALKADPGLRNVPVVILSSNQSPFDETRAHRVGAAGSLLKPFDSQVLTDQVTGYLNRMDGRSTAVPAPSALPPSSGVPERVGGEGLAVASEEEDDYGEFTIERPAGGSGAGPMPSRPMGASPRTVVPTPAPPAPRQTAPTLRPSLIPGVRPAEPIRSRNPTGERPAFTPAGERPPLNPSLSSERAGSLTGERPAFTPSERSPAAYDRASQVYERPAPTPDRLSQTMERPAASERPAPSSERPAALDRLTQTLERPVVSERPFERSGAFERPTQPVDRLSQTSERPVVSERSGSFERPSVPPDRFAPAPLPSAPVLTTPSSQRAPRTMTGLPMVAPPIQPPRSIPIPSSPMPRAPSAPVPILNTQVLPPAVAPVNRPILPTSPFPLVRESPAVAEAVSNAVAQKVAALSARGPEYEAIAKLTREVIEQVVWEVVPELAEVIIRQEIDRLVAKR